MKKSKDDVVGEQVDEDEPTIKKYYCRKYRTEYEILDLEQGENRSMELRINDALGPNKDVPEEPNQINSNQAPEPGSQRQLVDVFNRIEKKEQ